MTFCLDRVTLHLIGIHMTACSATLDAVRSMFSYNTFFSKFSVFIKRCHISFKNMYQLYVDFLNCCHIYLRNMDQL